MVWDGALAKTGAPRMQPEWWHRLQSAFGTASSAFVGASLQQLIAAARLPNSGICKSLERQRGVLGAKPKGEIECALVIQMACTHSAAMAVIAWGSGRGPNCRWDGVRGGTPAARLRHPGRAGKLANGERVKNALGTASSAFAAASPQQLIAAARLPNSGMSEIAVNASLAFIKGAKPKGEIECALVIQMACTHSAAMSVLGTFCRS